MKAPLPSINPADPPPFHQLDEIAFQEMCRDILEREEGIGTCEIYGVSGQGQYGIDLKAAARSNTHIEVAQCKCWEQLPISEIEKASEKFFSNIEFWRKKNVRRFI